MRNTVSWKVVLLFTGIPHMLIAQEDLDDLFLDDSFQDTEEAIETEEIPPAPTKPTPTFRLFFDVEQRYSYLFTGGSHMLNPGNIVYISPHLNEITVNNLFLFHNAARWLSAKLSQRIYIDLQSANIDATNLAYFVGYEVTEAYVGLHFWKERIGLQLGKILNRGGSAFLIHPSDPLFRIPGKDIWWAANRKKEAYHISSFRGNGQEMGSGQTVGSWMLELGLTLPFLSLTLAYLPQLDLDLEEFDRPHHSFFSKLSVSHFSAITPSIVFFYDDLPFVGMDIAASVGDEVTLHAEAGLSFENERPHLKEEGIIPMGPTERYPDYSLHKFGDGIFGEFIAGVSYTPENLFSILLEVFYTGKGLAPDQWEAQKDHIALLYQNYSTLKSSASPLAAAYQGMLGKYLEGLSPLRMRPLYLMLRIFRDDIFKRVWTERIDMAGTLVYSPYDTSFRLEGKLQWVAKKFFTLGFQFEYYFGMEGGIFTELPYTAKVGAYATLNF